MVVLLELVHLVVVLENANARYPAKTDEQTAPTSEYSKPSMQTAFDFILLLKFFLCWRSWGVA